ncbi:MAG: hypothetical protein LBM93_04030, partial [Oscillospiraceae bacterium]|nr:hypothetical protein [Oscillospiraceae bacterium]
MKLNILSKIPSFFLRLLNSLKKKITNIIVIINPKRDVNIEQNGIKNADSNVKDSDIKLTSKTIDLKEVKVIGRDDFNKEIHKKFNIEERHILVLYGQGGIGKTICSKYYAYTNKNYYKLILYMDFNENIKTTFATKCNFTENGFSRLSYEEKYIKIKEYLESLKEKCLILIDINDEEFNDFDINDIPENDNIKVLFATRCEDLCNATKIVVPKLKYEYLKQIFINNSEEINDNDNED